MRIITLALLLVVAHDIPGADTAAKSRECARLNEQIKRVHSQMRAGYSARKGERLAEKLRKLRRKRARACR